MKKNNHTPPSITASELHALEMQLKPIARDLLHAIATQLIRHFNYGSKEWATLVEALATYPEDLLCAAYHHALGKPVKHIGGLLECMQSFMAPEMRYRKMRHDYFIASLKESV